MLWGDCGEGSTGRERAGGQFLEPPCVDTFIHAGGDTSCRHSPQNVRAALRGWRVVEETCFFVCVISRFSCL